jgi:hypothetical protein
VLSVEDFGNEIVCVAAVEVPVAATSRRGQGPPCSLRGS